VVMSCDYCCRITWSYVIYSLVVEECCILWGTSRTRSKAQRIVSRGAFRQNYCVPDTGVSNPTKVNHERLL
jgi:hypothetical protein